MGYDLHISRRACWHDLGDPQITLAEWQDYAGQQADLVPFPVREAGVVVLDVGAPGGFGVKVSSGDWWGLMWYHGEIRTPNPPADLIQRMARIAQDLGARVLGDDDEVYGADGEPLAPARVAPTKNTNWLSRLLRR
ncbi:MAG: hypothetical protein KDK01_02510 [Rhodobacteraceae bacterium]|jgi:hypothetical protein|nr:hypothetical protein [Paracoccaceae bacterium]